MPASTTIVVGTGYLGLRFLQRYSGNPLLGLSRSAHKALQVEALDLDSCDASPLPLPDRYSVLYTVPPSNQSMGDPRLQRLLRKLMPAAQRFVYISSTGVYGDCDGAHVDEASPLNPTTKRAKRRVAAEKSVQSWSADNGCQVVILRVPGIYGPERLGVDRIRQGIAVIDESATGPGNRIHVDDLLMCCASALWGSAPAGIYNVGDGDHRSSSWFVNEVARQCAMPAPPSISMADAQRSFSARRMSFLQESRKASTRKMRDVLGVRPMYANAVEGIRASLKP